MGLANCKECGGLFVRVNRDVCDKCLKEQEVILQKVQRFIKENPKMTLSEVSEANEVDEGLILKFVRDNRLVLSPSSSGTSLACESCGAPITSGRLCGMCRSQLASGLGSGAAKTTMSGGNNSGRPVGGRAESRRRDSGAGDSVIKEKFQKR